LLTLCYLDLCACAAFGRQPNTSARVAASKPQLGGTPGPATRSSRPPTGWLTRGSYPCATSSQVVRPGPSPGRPVYQLVGSPGPATRVLSFSSTRDGHPVADFFLAAHEQILIALVLKNFQAQVFVSILYATSRCLRHYAFV
jgi:hypothetical protein